MNNIVTLQKTIKKYNSLNNNQEEWTEENLFNILAEEVNKITDVKEINYAIKEIINYLWNIEEYDDGGSIKWVNTKVKTDQHNNKLGIDPNYNNHKPGLSFSKSYRERFLNEYSGVYTTYRIKQACRKWEEFIKNKERDLELDLSEIDGNFENNPKKIKDFLIERFKYFRENHYYALIALEYAEDYIKEISECEWFKVKRIDNFEEAKKDIQDVVD